MQEKLLAGTESCYICQQFVFMWSSLLNKPLIMNMPANTSTHLWSPTSSFIAVDNHFSVEEVVTGIVWVGYNVLWRYCMCSGCWRWESKWKGAFGFQVSLQHLSCGKQKVSNGIGLKWLKREKEKHLLPKRPAFLLKTSFVPKRGCLSFGVNLWHFKMQNFQLTVLEALSCF